MKVNEYLQGFTDGVIATKEMVAARTDGQEVITGGAIELESAQDVIRKADIEKAAALLKLICEGDEDCEACPFRLDDWREKQGGHFCRLYGVPDEWELFTTGEKRKPRHQEGRKSDE